MAERGRDQRLFISVIGGGDCSKDEEHVAEEVGRCLAERGVTLICGGLGGVMEAACRGAVARGGTTIGVLPGNDRRDANEYVTIPIVTGMGYTRNAIVAKSGQAVIAIGGKYGTLSEIAYALQSRVPIVGIGTWSLSLRGHAEMGIETADNAADAVEKAIAAARKATIK